MGCRKETEDNMEGQTGRQEEQRQGCQGRAGEEGLLFVVSKGMKIAGWIWNKHKIMKELVKFLYCDTNDSFLR